MTSTTTKAGAPLGLSDNQRRLLRYTLVTTSAVTLMALVVLILWVMGRVLSALSVVVLPLSVAAVLALVLFPVVEFLERRARFGRLAAVLTIFVLFTAALGLALLFVIPAAIDQGAQFVSAIPDMAQRAYATLVTSFPQAMSMLTDALADVEVQEWLPEPAAITEATWKYVGILVGMGFVPLYLFFALLSGERLRDSAREAVELFDYETQNEVLYLGGLFIGYVTAFFRGQLSIALIMGLMMATGFTLAGLNAAIFLGLALGLLSIVPYLGVVVGLLTVIPVAYVQPDGGVHLVAMVLGVITLTQIVESLFLTPKIMAGRSGLHPVLVVISILFWGTVLNGVIGMILAVPLTAFLLTCWKHLKSRISRTIELDPAHDHSERPDEEPLTIRGRTD